MPVTDIHLLTLLQRLDTIRENLHLRPLTSREVEDIVKAAGFSTTSKGIINVIFNRPKKKRGRLYTRPIKPYTEKKCLYWGTQLPKRPVTILGNIIYDMSKLCMYFILNYYPQGKGLKFHWEIEEEPPTMENRVKTELANEETAKMLEADPEADARTPVF